MEEKIFNLDPLFSSCFSLFTRRVRRTAGFVNLLVNFVRVLLVGLFLFFCVCGVGYVLGLMFGLC